MNVRRPAPEYAPTSEANRDRRARLVVALHNAGPDLDAGAARFAALEDETTGDVDRVDETRTVLLARLYRRSSDFAATTALKALDTYSAGVRADAPSSAPERLRRAGLSSSDRTRRRLHLKSAA